jgi:hypothetical protein
LQDTGSITINAPEYRIVIADVHNAASFGDTLAGAMRRGGGRLNPKDAGTQFANAHLITAAPDLLAACESLEVYARVQVERHSDADDTPVWGALLAALAKARGQK